MVHLRGICRDQDIGLRGDLRVLQSEAKVKYIIIQMNECDSISLELLGHLGKLVSTESSEELEICLVEVNKILTQFIKNSEYAEVLKIKESLRGAMLDWGLTEKPKLDTKFINPFLVSTQKVMQAQCGLDPKPMKMFLKKPGDPLLLGDISGVIPIKSETFNGTLAISLSESFFLKIVEIMLGEKLFEMKDEYSDLVCELVNIILGQSKVILGQSGYAIDRTLPVSMK